MIYDKDPNFKLSQTLWYWFPYCLGVVDFKNNIPIDLSCVLKLCIDLYN